MPDPDKRARIFSVVASIPRGRVTTYGRVAEMAGCAGQARQVGYALAALPADTTLPWHRVINARGEISLRTRSDGHRLQRALLTDEGVEFGPQGRVSLARFGWYPDSG
jgi:methylated-DNA-protein-cysteine methyltransferase-like protein